MDTLREHPMAAIFPEMAESDFDSLVADIRIHGVREPIWLYEGKILDGRNRYRACQKAEKKCPTRAFMGSREDALALVWSMNRERRHLSSSQAAVADTKRALLVAEYAAEIEKLKVEARKKAGRPKKSTERIPEISPRSEREVSVARARAAGTNRKYLEAAERLVKDHPKKAEEVLRGEKTIPQAMREVKAEPQEVTAVPPPPTPESPESIDPATGLYMPDGRPPRVQGQVFAEEGKLVDTAVEHIKAACKAIRKCQAKYGFGEKSLEDLRTVYEELGHIVKGAK